MKPIQRYENCYEEGCPSEDGPWVYFDAHKEEVERLEKALQSIANIWPIETSTKIASVSGINDGKSRAIIAEGAVTIARKALGIEKMP